MAEFNPTQNPYEDRITALLQKRAQPYNTEQIGLAGQSAQLRALAGQDTSIDKVLQSVLGSQTDRELQSTQGLYDLFEKKRAAGDAQSQALFDKIKLFTGGDPQGTQLFIEQLHADPDEIDPGNAFQVMTKLAGIAKRTGYRSPDSQLASLKIQKAQRDLSGGGGKPQSGVGKLGYDLKMGLIDQETYDAAIRKETLAKGVVTPEKAKAAFDNARARTERVTSKIDEVLPRISGTTAGFVGGMLSDVGGTSARDLKADIDTIKANIGFDELQRLRDSSPTGGALGQVTERELGFLQSVISNLETSQSPGQLRKNLETAKQEIEDSWSRVAEAYEQDFGQSSAPAQVAQPEAFKFLGFE